jgi:uncharacterized protein (TIGR00725 family)
MAAGDPRPAGAGANVAVIGASAATAEQLWAAEEVGAGLAVAGAVVITGGLGGVMEAACRGARSRRGTTIGLLPGLDRSEANGWVTVAVPTGLGDLRNALVVRSADAVIAIGGAYGTLTEIGFALGLERPVVGLSTWQIHGVEHVDTPAEAVRLLLSRLSQ